MRIRAHLRLVSVIWLCCQAAAFAAAPYVLCHDHGVMQMGNGHECGQTCPLHHHAPPAPADASHAHHHHQEQSELSAPTSTGASIDCRCVVSDAALGALMHDAGVFPGEFTLDAISFTARVSFADDAAPTRSSLPNTPPPRV